MTYNSSYYFEVYGFFSPNVFLSVIIVKPDEFELDVNAPTKARLKDFAARIQSYTSLLPTTDAFDLGKHIAESSGIVSALKEDPSDKDRIDNIEELLDSIKAFTEREPESAINEATGELISEYFPTLDHYLETVSNSRLISLA